MLMFTASAHATGSASHIFLDVIALNNVRCKV